MKNYALLFLLLSVLFGCGSDDITKEDVKMSNEYCVVFKSFNQFKQLHDSLNLLTDDKLNSWNENDNFNSLFDIYKDEDEEAANCIVDNDFENSKIFRVDDALASLLNKNGILEYSDTIVMVKGPFMYLIGNNDYSVVGKINNNENVSYMENVKVIQHSRILELKQENDLRSFDERTDVWMISDNERAYVNFEGKRVFILAENAYFIRFRMVGRYQKKLLGIWLTPANAKMSFARITVRGLIENINDNGTWMGTEYNVEDIEMPFVDLYGQKVDVDVTFKYTRLNRSGEVTYNYVQNL